MEMRPHYKQTEVGVIPDSWTVERLGTLLRYERPDSYIVKSTAYDDAGRTPVLTANKSFLIGYTNEQFGICYDLPAIIFDDFTTDSKFVEVPFKVKSSAIKILRCKSDTTSLEFIHGKMQFTQFPVGGHKRHYISEYQELLFAVPEEGEQRAIATVLSDVDAFIRSLEQLVTKKRHIRQGSVQQLLSGKKRLPGFKGPWEAKRLGNTAFLKARIGWQGLTTAEYLESGDHFLVTGTEFTDGYIDWSQCHYVDESRYKQDKNIQLKEQDVLVTKDGTIGKVALVASLPLPATLNSGVFVIRPIDGAFDPRFFFYLLGSNLFASFLSQLSAGSTINHLYQKDFVGFVYKTPPTIGEQSAIAAILSDMDAEIAALEAKWAKAREVKQGVMQELLTGRIRVV